MITPDLLHQRIEIFTTMQGSPVVAVSDLFIWVGLSRGRWLGVLRNLPDEWKPQGTFRAGNSAHMYTSEASSWLKRLTAEFPKQFGVGEQQP